ncbi:MAG: hypothetical protein KA331_06450 [Acinetobacter sp.]|nr:hypothetical protein [Acinetobacter sp.]MBP7217714.1 hypothetical protein [Acinetobacter sp.]
MYMANRRFELQYSRFALLLQLLVFIGISGVLYVSLTLGLWLLSLLLLSVAWWLFQQQPKIQRFEYLSGTDWSFALHSSANIQRRSIAGMLDHHCYVVLYFTERQHVPCVIWWDQLSTAQWQQLKLCVKLH